MKQANVMKLRRFQERAAAADAGVRREQKKCEVLAKQGATRMDAKCNPTSHLFVACDSSVKQALACITACFKHTSVCSDRLLVMHTQDTPARD